MKSKMIYTVIQDNTNKVIDVENTSPLLRNFVDALCFLLIPH